MQPWRFTATLGSHSSEVSSAAQRDESYERMTAPSGSDPQGRVVAHFDADCFYAQAEVLRRPYLKDRPVGITQKFLVVTSNYVARSLGVPKMASIDEAKRRCPELVLINGEDLTPYRVASKQILGVLGRFGIVERLGLDEAAVDISAEVRNRLAAGASVQNFSGHIIAAEVAETHRVPSTMAPQSQEASDHVLMLASHLVSEIRTAVERETGFCLSCGVSHNKMLAKLVCSVNKPNKQTSLPQTAVASFLDPLPVRKIPGVGKRTESMLNEMGAETVKDVQNLSLEQLSARLGDRVGKLLYNACRGYDSTPVRDKGHPKSLSVEDSFRMCTTMNAAEERLRSLAPDLVFRLDTDREETGREPALFTLKWRYQESWKFTSLSAPMPPDLSTKSAALEKRVEAAVEVAMRLLSKGLRGRPSYNLAVLNIGATNFEPETTGGLKSDIRLFLSTPGKLPKKDSRLVPSKREARARRELSENKKAVSVGSSLLSGLEPDSYMKRFRLFNVLAAAEEAENILHMGHADDGQTSEDNKWEDFEVCADGDAWQLPGSSHEEQGGNQVQDSTAQKSLEAQTPRFSKPGDKKQRCHTKESSKTFSSSFRCAECQREISNSDVGRQEHEDYHFALKLANQEGGVQEGTHVACVSSIQTQKGSRGKGKSVSLPKRAKLRNATLDSFVIQHHGSSGL